MNVLEDLIHHRHHPEENTVTDTATETTAQETAAPKRSFLATLHGNLDAFDASLAHFLPVLRGAVTNRRLDELIEAALAASGLGVEDAVFTTVTDALRAASARKAPADPAAGDGQQAAM